MNQTACSVWVFAHELGAFHALSNPAFLGISLVKLRRRDNVDFIYVLANRRGSMFFYALMKMACSITDIICIAQITLEDIKKH